MGTAQAREKRQTDESEDVEATLLPGTAHTGGNDRTIRATLYERDHGIPTLRNGGRPRSRGIGASRGHHTKRRLQPFSYRVGTEGSPAGVRRSRLLTLYSGVSVARMRASNALSAALFDTRAPTLLPEQETIDELFTAAYLDLCHRSFLSQDVSRAFGPNEEFQSIVDERSPAVYQESQAALAEAVERQYHDVLGFAMDLIDAEDRQLAGTATEREDDVHFTQQQDDSSGTTSGATDYGGGVSYPSLSAPGFLAGGGSVGNSMAALGASGQDQLFASSLGLTVNTPDAAQQRLSEAWVHYVVPSLGRVLAWSGFFFCFWNSAMGEQFGQRELRATRWVLDCHVAHLHVPPCYHIRYRGRGVTVIAMVPVGESATVADSRTPEVSVMAQQVASAFSLLPFCAAPTAPGAGEDGSSSDAGGAPSLGGAAPASAKTADGGEALFRFLPKNVQVHFGRDGRYYFLSNRHWFVTWLSSRRQLDDYTQHLSYVSPTLLATRGTTLSSRAFHAEAFIAENKQAATFMKREVNVGLVELLVAERDAALRRSGAEVSHEAAAAIAREAAVSGAGDTPPVSADNEIHGRPPCTDAARSAAVNAPVFVSVLSEPPSSQSSGGLPRVKPTTANPLVQIPAPAHDARVCVNSSADDTPLLSRAAITRLLCGAPDSDGELVEEGVTNDRPNAPQPVMLSADEELPIPNAASPPTRRTNKTRSTAITRPASLPWPSDCTGSLIQRFDRAGYPKSLLGALLLTLMSFPSPPVHYVREVRREIVFRGLKAFVYEQMYDTRFGTQPPAGGGRRSSFREDALDKRRRGGWNDTNASSLYAARVGDGMGDANWVDEGEWGLSASRYSTDGEGDTDDADDYSDDSVHEDYGESEEESDGRNRQRPGDHRHSGRSSVRHDDGTIAARERQDAQSYESGSDDGEMDSNILVRARQFWRLFMGQPTVTVRGEDGALPDEDDAYASDAWHRSRGERGGTAASASLGTPSPNRHGESSDAHQTRTASWPPPMHQKDVGSGSAAQRGDVAAQPATWHPFQSRRVDATVSAEQATRSSAPTTVVPKGSAASPASCATSHGKTSAPVLVNGQHASDGSRARLGRSERWAVGDRPYRGDELEATLSVAPTTTGTSGYSVRATAAAAAAAAAQSPVNCWPDYGAVVERVLMAFMQYDGSTQPRVPYTRGPLAASSPFSSVSRSLPSLAAQAADKGGSSRPPQTSARQPAVQCAFVDDADGTIADESAMLNELYVAVVLPRIYRKFRLSPRLLSLRKPLDEEDKRMVYDRLCTALGVRVADGRVVEVRPIIKDFFTSRHCVSKGTAMDAPASAPATAAAPPLTTAQSPIADPLSLTGAGSVRYTVPRWIRLRTHRLVRRFVAPSLTVKRGQEKGVYAIATNSGVHQDEWNMCAAALIPFLGLQRFAGGTDRFCGEPELWASVGRVIYARVSAMPQSPLPLYHALEQECFGLPDASCGVAVSGLDGVFAGDGRSQSQASQSTTLEAGATTTQRGTVRRSGDASGLDAAIALRKGTTRSVPDRAILFALLRRQYGSLKDTLAGTTGTIMHVAELTRTAAQCVRLHRTGLTGRERDGTDTAELDACATLALCVAVARSAVEASILADVLLELLHNPFGTQYRCCTADLVECLPLMKELRASESSRAASIAGRAAGGELLGGRGQRDLSALCNEKDMGGHGATTQSPVASTSPSPSTTELAADTSNAKAGPASGVGAGPAMSSASPPSDGQNLSSAEHGAEESSGGDDEEDAAAHTSPAGRDSDSRSCDTRPHQVSDCMSASYATATSASTAAATSGGYSSRFSSEYAVVRHMIRRLEKHCTEDLLLARDYLQRAVGLFREMRESAPTSSPAPSPGEAAAAAARRSDKADARTDGQDPSEQELSTSSFASWSVPSPLNSKDSAYDEIAKLLTNAYRVFSLVDGKHSPFALRALANLAVYWYTVGRQGEWQDALLQLRATWREGGPEDVKQLLKSTYADYLVGRLGASASSTRGAGSFLQSWRPGAAASSIFSASPANTGISVEQVPISFIRIANDD